MKKKISLSPAMKLAIAAVATAIFLLSLMQLFLFGLHTR